MSDKKREKHKCPRLPDNLSKVTPQGWHGESVDQAKQMWYAWVRIVSRQTPMPRNTNGPR